MVWAILGFIYSTVCWIGTGLKESGRSGNAAGRDLILAPGGRALVLPACVPDTISFLLYKNLYME